MSSPALSQHEAGRRQRQRDSSLSKHEKVAWRVKEWAAAVGIGPTKTHALIRDKRVKSIMLDGRRLITTSPADFIASLSGEGE